MAPSRRTLFRCLLSLWVVGSLWLLAGCEDDYDPYADYAKHPKEILVLGNSITVHPPLEDLWWGTWGMAAQTRNDDFVHRLQAKIDSLYPQEFRVVPVNIADWERSLSDSVFAAALDTLIHTNTVGTVFRLGENAMSAEADAYTAALDTAVRATRHRMAQVSRFRSTDIVMTDVFWYWSLQHIVKATNAYASDSCHQVVYVELPNEMDRSLIANVGYVVEGNDGEFHTIESNSVGRHPNNEGMEAIAERIFAALQSQGLLKKWHKY